jgi:hypothetical protein
MKALLEPAAVIQLTPQGSGTSIQFGARDGNAWVLRERNREPA